MENTKSPLAELVPYYQMKTNIEFCVQSKIAVDVLVDATSVYIFSQGDDHKKKQDTWISSKTDQTRINIKNVARSNADIVL